MLDWGVFLKPGVDTRLPDRSAAQLRDICERHGLCLDGKDVCVVGFGGSYGIGVALLDAGARRVVLQDPYAPIRHARIRRLDSERLQRYFRQAGTRWEPDPNRLAVVREQLSDYAARNPASVDVVFSSSVLEHVDDVEGLLRACAAVTRPGGLNVHAIDLRDHYFPYPFEMLCYSRRTWENWLNSSNLNRWRLPDYQNAFARHFGTFDLFITEALPAEFAKVKRRIRPEFITGDDAIDNVGTVRVEARKAA